MINTQMIHGPEIPKISLIVLAELREHVDKAKLEECMGLSGRSDTVGMLGRMLAEAIEKSAIYWINGTSRIFNGLTYEEFTRDDMAVAIRKFVSNPQYGFSPSVCRNGSIQDLCQTVMTTVRTRRLEPDHNLVSLQNGVLNLTTLEMVPHNKGLTPFCYLDFRYDPTAECPRWRAFLDDVLPPTTIKYTREEARQKQDLLQEFCGAPLINRKEANIEKMMILYGSGSNGKSVVAHTITSLYGKENCTHFSFDELLTSGDQAKNTAKMNGRLLNYAEEIQAVNCAKFGDRLKVLISGEPVNARSMWGDPFSAEDIPLLMANANKLPKMDDASHGLLRRLIIIDFDKIIPQNKQDLTLSQKLMEERSGIFNWILEGRERFINSGYKFSHLDVIRASAEEYMANNNAVLQFMHDMDRHPTYESIKDCVPTRISLKQLYSEYDKWSVERHLRLKSYNDFRATLDAAGYTKKKTNVGMVYECYGETLSQQRLANGVDLEEYMSAPRKTRPFVLADGRVVTTNLFHAAIFVHMSYSWMKMMSLAGKFDGALLSFDEIKELGISRKRVSIYDLHKLEKIVDRIYKKDPDQIEAHRRHTTECVSFNIDMARKKMPFRKFETGMLKSGGNMRVKPGEMIIFVPVDWEYTEENAKKELEAYENENKK